MSQLKRQLIPNCAKKFQGVSGEAMGSSLTMRNWTAKQFKQNLKLPPLEEAVFSSHSVATKLENLLLYISSLISLLPPQIWRFCKVAEQAGAESKGTGCSSPRWWGYFQSIGGGESCGSLLTAACYSDGILVISVLSVCHKAQSLIALKP